eukprot:Opistho-2@26805
MRDTPTTVKTPSTAMRVLGVFKRDSSVSDRCALPSCGSSLGFFDKKITCRCCQNVFCSTHCSCIVRLNPSGTPDPEGEKYKVCFSCDEAYSKSLQAGKFTENKKVLARRLSIRSDKKDLVERNIIRQDSMSEMREDSSDDSDRDDVSDGDNDEDDEDDDVITDMPAIKVRRDSLDIKLGNRPDRRNLVDRNIVTEASDEEKQAIHDKLEKKLQNHLATRPEKVDLIDRNILKGQNVNPNLFDSQESLKWASTVDILNNAMKRRPSIAELEERNILINFRETVDVGTTFTPGEYDRKVEKTWTRLTAKDKVEIKRELNEFKRTMDVHDESKHMTRFHV